MHVYDCGKWSPNNNNKWKEYDTSMHCGAFYIPSYAASVVKNDDYQEHQ